MTELLDSLGEAGADEQVAALLARDPAAHVSLDDPASVVLLLGRLREAGADKQATTLADRVAVHASPDNSWSMLLGLTGGLAGHVSLDHPRSVAFLLDSLREAGADEQVAALLARDPAAHVSPDDPYSVAFLLDSLREAGADEQVAALLARDPAAHVGLDDPRGIGLMLDSLQKAGADEQVAALLARDPAAHVSLDDPRGIGLMLDSLQKAGADEQMAVLTSRLPSAGRFDLFLRHHESADRFRFGREADGTPAAPCHAGFPVIIWLGSGDARGEHLCLAGIGVRVRRQRAHEAGRARLAGDERAAWCPLCRSGPGRATPLTGLHAPRSGGQAATRVPPSRAFACAVRLAGCPR